MIGGEHRPQILIVEDEPKFALVLQDYLRSANFATTWVADPHAVRDVVSSTDPDLILLDVLLPSCDGMTLCRELREARDTPIIMLSARTAETDRILGLEMGADDYICKPASPREVVARVNAVLRRVRRSMNGTHGERLMLDDERFEAVLDGHALPLTPVEFRLLRKLAAQPGRIFARGQLLDALYEDHRVVADRTVDVHVKNLRRKIRAVCPDESIVRTIYGIGYRFELEARADRCRRS